MKFNVIGAIEFVDQETYEDKFGYTKSISNHVVLFYENSTNSAWMQYKYFKDDEDKYQVLYDYMIKQEYTIKEAQEKFPELFL